MRVFTTNDFTGHWPVGTGAVIVAVDEVHARGIMDDELRARRLPLAPYTLTELDPEVPAVRVLTDGNY